MLSAHSKGVSGIGRRDGLRGNCREAGREDTVTLLSPPEKLKTSVTQKYCLVKYYLRTLDFEGAGDKLAKALTDLRRDRAGNPGLEELRREREGSYLRAFEKRR